MEETAADPVLLVSCEGTEMAISAAAAALSTLLRMSLDEQSSHDNVVPLPVSTAALQKIIEFCTHYAEEEPMAQLRRPIKKSLSATVQPWYSQFVESLPPSTLLDLAAASNYMDITPLHDLTCTRIGVMTQNKTPQEVATILGITEEMSPELVQKLQDSLKWSTE
jgi:hypothetical protein